MPTGVIDWIHLLNAEEDSDYHPLEKKKEKKKQKNNNNNNWVIPHPMLGDVLFYVLAWYLETFCTLWCSRFYIYFSFYGIY